jgi:hypothetical protein
VGVDPKRMRFRQHLQHEMAHYAGALCACNPRLLAVGRPVYCLCTARADCTACALHVLIVLPMYCLCNAGVLSACCLNCACVLPV